ncbi:hypothetical protein O181_117297 [Austropuccinia psidii MF-1]|uniref:Uncharacterized protein n=1 Tax=Austropuccinia psidii MF-1 TaxID=1389203 RepID=A0A9Q3PZ98_9BASI|nr:hypothetical protein [Austropuccinia psidii MF-1]
MPIQHSPPERQTRSQARTQAFLTPTPRATLDGTPAVSQLRSHYVPVVVGRIVLSPVSKGLKTSLPNLQANFPAREKPD